MSTRRPDDIPYADASRILAEALAAFLPPLGITVAEHAATHRWVKSPAGSNLERWSHDTAPYLTEPMEVLSDGQFDTVAIVGPAASGKTMVAENWLLACIENDPADLLWYMHQEAELEAYVKGRIEPMLEQHEKLIGGLRHGRDSVSFKRFRGMHAEFLPFTASKLVNKHVSRIVADEWDAFDATLGDPRTLLDPRRQAAAARGDSMLLAISHPDRALPLDRPVEQQRGIMSVYLAGDRRRWWWPCARCGAFSSPNPGTPRRMTICYPEDAPPEVVEEEAHLLCPVCQGKVFSHERDAMNRAGRWVARGEEIDEDGRVTGTRFRSTTASLWIMGAMSPFVLGGIGGLARRRVEAERAAAATGDDKDLRQVMVKGWCEPYTPPRTIGAVDAQGLMERVAQQMVRNQVPEGARFISIFADTNGTWFEWAARAWGVGGESWVIAHEQVRDVEPASDPECWDDLLRMLVEREFPLSDGSGRVMRARVVGFDSMGEPGVTDQAMAAWRRARRAGLARAPMVIRGRLAWTLVPTKGAAHKMAARITMARPETQRKDRKSMRGDDPLLLFNPNLAKDALVAQLNRGEIGPGYVHLPAWLKTPEDPSAWFDQLAAERRQKDGTWKKFPEGARNEALDLVVGTEIVARLHGQHRIDWDRPPAWAAEWDVNSMVYKPDPASAVDVPAKPAGGDPSKPLLVAMPPRPPSPRDMGGGRPMISADAARAERIARRRELLRG